MCELNNVDFFVFAGAIALTQSATQHRVARCGEARCRVPTMDRPRVEHGTRHKIQNRRGTSKPEATEDAINLLTLPQAAQPPGHGARRERPSRPQPERQRVQLRKGGYRVHRHRYIDI